MGLKSLKNKVTNKIFESLIEMYPTGYTDDKECPNLLFIVNKKEHVDYLIDVLEVDVHQINSENEKIIDNRLNDDVKSYKYWKYLSFFNNEAQQAMMAKKRLEMSSFETLSSFFNGSLPLQNLLIKKFHFFKNIDNYSTICNVNDIVKRFLKDYKEELKDENNSLIMNKMMGSSFDHAFQNSLPLVSKYLHKDILLELISDFKLFENTSIFYLYKNNIIDEHDFKEFINKNPNVYRYTKKEDLELIIDKNTGFFKDYLNVYDITKDYFGFYIANSYKNYLNHACLEKINLIDKKGENILFEILSESEIERNPENIEESLKLFLEKGGDVSTVNVNGDNILSKIKKNENLLFAITLLNDNDINIFDAKYYNIFGKKISDFLKIAGEKENTSELNLTFFKNEIIKLEKISLLKNIENKDETKIIKRL